MRPAEGLDRARAEPGARGERRERACVLDLQSCRKMHRLLTTSNDEKVALNGIFFFVDKIPTFGFLNV